MHASARLQLLHILKFEAFAVSYAGTATLMLSDFELSCYVSRQTGMLAFANGSQHAHTHRHILSGQESSLQLEKRLTELLTQQSPLM